MAPEANDVVDENIPPVHTSRADTVLINLLALVMTLSNDPMSTQVTPRMAAADTLRQAVDSSRQVRESGAMGLTQLVSGCSRASDHLGESRLGASLGELVYAGRWRALTEPTTAVEWLEGELSDIIKDLEFEPVMESDLPVGFPAPTPVREIELKEYPVYRSASAPLNGSGSGGAFWKLFTHIKANNIAMTTPVEMSYEQGVYGLRETTMAFLYGDPKLGTVGQDGKIEIADEDSNWVVSIGCRGRESEVRIAAGQAALLEWILARPDLTVAGDLRVMGYNSPMVRGNRRYFEVQIPVLRFDPVVVDFSDARQLDVWRPVNDSVMGGRSTSRISSTGDGTGLFAGNMSLENNGGFASVRSGSIAGRLEGAERIVVRFRGDGQNYKLRLRSDAAERAVSYQAPFETVAGEWSERVFEASDFSPVWRGRLVRNPPVLKLADVTDLGFMISDKQAGAFRLELGAIEKR
jgi:hypothetical protein